MFDFLDRLREKPEATRLQVTILVAGAATIFIAFVWISIGGLSVDSKESESGDPSPFNRAAEHLGRAFGAVGEQFGDVRSSFDELQQSPNFQAPDDAVKATPRSQNEIEFISASSSASRDFETAGQGSEMSGSPPQEGRSVVY